MLNTHKRVCGIVAFSLLGTLLTSLVQAASPDALVVRADMATPSPYDDGIRWEVMVEQWEGGVKKAVQQFSVHSKGENTLAEYTAPGNLRGRKFLMKHRSMWFLKPGLFKPVPLSPRQRMLGAASYGDVISVGYADKYTVAKKSEVVLEGEPCVLFEMTAQHKDEAYQRLRYWVSKSRGLGVRTEYFSTAGTLLKWTTSTYENQLAVGPESRVFVSRIVIHDANNKDSVAVIHFRAMSLSQVSDATFDLNLLSH